MKRRGKLGEEQVPFFPDPAVILERDGERDTAPHQRTGACPASIATADRVAQVAF